MFYSIALASRARGSSNQQQGYFPPILGWNHQKDVLRSNSILFDQFGLNSRVQILKFQDQLLHEEETSSLIPGLQLSLNRMAVFVAKCLGIFMEVQILTNGRGMKKAKYTWSLVFGLPCSSHRWFAITNSLLVQYCRFGNEKDYYSLTVTSDDFVKNQIIWLSKHLD